MEWPALLAPPANMQVRYQLVDALSGAPVPNLDAKLCSPGDPNCTSALTGVARSDPDGMVSFDVSLIPFGFGAWPFAYIDVRGAGIPDSLVYILPPPTRARTDLRSVVTHQVVDSILPNLPGGNDPSRGFVLTRFRSCGYTAPAPGVVVTTSAADASVVYFSGITYDLKRTATDDGALVGISNVPPGSLRIDATLGTTGQHVATLNVQVRPNAGTYAFLFSPVPE